jgi:transcriptional regulator
MVIVRGPQAYISPGFYASKAEHGRVVPPWNYVTALDGGRHAA